MAHLVAEQDGTGILGIDPVRIRESLELLTPSLQGIGLMKALNIHWPSKGQCEGVLPRRAW